MLPVLILVPGYRQKVSERVQLRRLRIPPRTRPHGTPNQRRPTAGVQRAGVVGPLRTAETDVRESDSGRVGV